MKKHGCKWVETTRDKSTEGAPSCSWQLYNHFLVAGDCRNEWDIRSCRQNFFDDFFEASFSKREGNGNLQGSFFRGDETMQMYGNFEGFPQKNVHCCVWCHVMTPDPFPDFWKESVILSFDVTFFPIQWYLRGYYLPILTQKVPLRKLRCWTLQFFVSGRPIPLKK